MKSLIFFCAIYLLIFRHSIAQDQLQKGLERLNFFPDADAFLLAQFENTRLNIETPVEPINTKEVNNYSNILSLHWAQRLNRRLFLGVRGSFEEASENAVSYGTPIGKRFHGRGFKEVEFNSLYRLRFQKDESGLIDLFLSYSPYLGDREVGGTGSKRFNGRDILRINLSHGLWEEIWEFKTALNYQYFGQGEERNAFENSNFQLDSYFILNFQFLAQYQITPWLFAFGGVGFDYTSVEVIHEKGLVDKEAQTGTGSLFEAGLKKPLGKWSLLELNYLLNRYDYFVKGELNNLDGDATRQVLSLTYKLAF